MNYTPGIIWRTTSTYIDIDTGEVIRKTDVHETHKYIIIKTKKNVRTNFNNTKGEISYIVECRRNPQKSLY